MCYLRRCSSIWASPYPMGEWCRVVSAGGHARPQQRFWCGAELPQCPLFDMLEGLHLSLPPPPSTLLPHMPNPTEPTIKIPLPLLAM